MTPKEFLASYVEGFNAGTVNSLIMMYEADASARTDYKRSGKYTARSTEFHRYEWQTRYESKGSDSDK